MFERRISFDDVRSVIENGEIIEDYPNDLPYPSRLLLGTAKGRPLHVVAAEDKSSGAMIVITVYEPDPTLWTGGFRRRVKVR